MTDEKHADQQYDSRQKGIVFETAVSDIASQKQYDHGGGEWEQPGCFPEFRDLYGGQISQNAIQEL